MTHPPPFDRLDLRVAESVLTRWPCPCEEMFECLAREHPDQLLQFMQSPEMQASDLTFAAEIAGRLVDPIEHGLLPLLLRTLLQHASAVVREGAIYGISTTLDVVEEAAWTLARMAESDSSPAVRTAAREALEINALAERVCASQTKSQTPDEIREWALRLSTDIVD